MGFMLDWEMVPYIGGFELNHTKNCEPCDCCLHVFNKVADRPCFRDSVGFRTGNIQCFP